MKRLLIAASCLALVLPSMTIAQSNPDQNTKPAPGQGQRPSRPGNGGGGAPNRPNPGKPGGGPGAGGPGGGGAPNRPNPGGPGGGGPGAGGPNRPGNPNRPGILPINPPGAGYRPPNQRPPNNRPGILPIRPGHGWNGRRYRAGLFRYPPGYGYRHWARGQTLPLLFLSAAYYFTNYAILGLDPPPYGYQWVRYGPDVLLVNIRTGQIMDVEYGVFY